MINQDSIVLGGGCFWCTEAIYNQIKGVHSVTSGYAGGNTVNPTYSLVCEGDTGHAEVIKVEFDFSVITLDKILEVFWDIHNPTSLNKQGSDIGTQYRSIILYTNDSQLLTINQSLKKQQSVSQKPIVTEVKKLTNFYPAEDYHREYFSNNPLQPYCSLVISPKIKHFKEKYQHLLKDENQS